eukprot:TRINITY_DN20410_c0_g1_i1.p1 TRINITY_DN20410_c0_g1~~TRINITY_DN20410_c0_g1_i1.p1  ORF type:complete len:326 (+),score=69.30 TRINITY_DN20410_c0_g1_i1:91-1068(+)
MFSSWGVAEVFFLVGMVLGVCLCVAVAWYCMHLVAWRCRPASRRVYYTDPPTVPINYEGAVRHVPYADLLEEPGEHFFKRVNNILQLNSTYHDLRVVKNWDTPEYEFLAPHEALRKFLCDKDALRAKEVPLLVLREKFNVTGAFPWLYPIGHASCFGNQTHSREVVVTDQGITESVTQTRSVCFGIREGARVRRAPPLVGEGTALRCDISSGQVLVAWDGAERASSDSSPPAVWEFWGHQGQFTILPAAHPAGSTPQAALLAFREFAGTSYLIPPGPAGIPVASESEFTPPTLGTAHAADAAIPEAAAGELDLPSTSAPSEEGAA